MKKPNLIVIEIDWLDEKATVYFSDHKNMQRNRGAKYDLTLFSSKRIILNKQ